MIIFAYCFIASKFPPPWCPQRVDAIMLTIFYSVSFVLPVVYNDMMRSCLLFLVGKSCPTLVSTAS